MFVSVDIIISLSVFLHVFSRPKAFRAHLRFVHSIISSDKGDQFVCVLFIALMSFYEFTLHTKRTFRLSFSVEATTAH